MDSSNSEEDTCTPPDIRKVAEATSNELLPDKSRFKYEHTYKKFMQWTIENKIKVVSENVMLAYMQKLSQTFKPSTLWVKYSMLRSTLLIKNDVDISKFLKLKSFLKSKSSGYKTKKSKILTKEQIKQFLDKAPDNKYLFTKVVLIFGISGGCRRQELKKLEINNIRDLGNELLVKLIDTKTKVDRNFIISGNFYEICKKYINLRPNRPEFLLNYQNGKCFNQVVGINKIGNQPKEIAKFLELPDYDLYTGHSFRRSGASILADAGGDTLTVKNFGGWKSTTVMETYVEQSLSKKQNIGKTIHNSIQHCLEEPSTSAECHSYPEPQGSSTINKETTFNLNLVPSQTIQSSSNTVERDSSIEELEKTNIYKYCNFYNCTFVKKISL